MTIVFQPKLELAAGAPAPDSYSESDGLVPPDSFVVSRKRNGDVASTFGERIWDFTAYHPEQRPLKLYFKYWGDEEESSVRDQLSREMRMLAFILVWKREGPPLAVRTLPRSMCSLAALARYAENHKCRIQDVLNNADYLVDLAETTGAQMPRWLDWVLRHLQRLGPARLGFTIVGTAVQKRLRILAQNYKATIKQHAPMPTRVYSAVLTALSKELTDWECVATPYLALMSESAKNPLLGRGKSAQDKISQALGLSKAEYQPVFDDVVGRHGVRPYMEAHGLTNSLMGLLHGLLEVQVAAKLTVQAYTGMRHDEAETLPYDCSETTNIGGKTHYTICGKTTKLNHGLIQHTRWVTNQEGHRAALIAREIADAIYDVCGGDSRDNKAIVASRPLFVTASYFQRADRKSCLDRGVFLPAFLAISSCPALRDRLQPAIQEEDLLELEHIDPHRAWRSEAKFAIGTPWTLTSHQFRRSLAIYAQASGLVTLPSLRRQLHHLTVEMSQYYARGSAYAKDFIGDDKDHFAREWQNTQAESSALGYMLNVILSEEKQGGGHGNFVNHQLTRTGGVVPDRAKMMRLFKAGELAYRDTVLGGCTNTGTCEKRRYDVLDIDCLAGCPNMVVSLPKLERAIAIKTKRVAAMEPGTDGHQMEDTTLGLLVSARTKILQQRNGVPQ